MNSVQIKVAEQIANIAPAVEDKVVGVIVDRETDKRSTALVNSIDKLDKTEKDLKKIKPDQISYDEKGEKVSETYSKSKLDERNKLTKQIDRISKAINKALETNDYGEVYNIASGKNTESSGDADKSEASDSSSE